ncbi:MAG: glycosylase, partial [Calditrichales bacterium]
MKEIYNQVKTPYKYGIVLKDSAGRQVDSPSVFRYDSTWYMIYICMNEIGYETYLACSTDLLAWQPLGCILPFRKEGWDAFQAAGYAALQDHQWGGSAQLQKYDEKYWLSYLGGALQGYETDPLAIGMAWSGTPHLPRPWMRYQVPVLSREQTDVREFENLTQYKSNIIYDRDRSLGYPFVMFYNGKKKSGYERIGMAVSDDMLHWRRFGQEAVIDNGSGLSGDPQ